MASRFSSPPPRTPRAAVLPPVRSSSPPMTPATELYMSLKSGAVLQENFDDKRLLEPVDILYVPGEQSIGHFEPVVFACRLSFDPAVVRHVWEAYNRHGLEVPITKCLEQLLCSSMHPVELQQLHRWIYGKTGLPLEWPRCDLYMSLRHGCPAVLDDFEGDAADSRLLPVALEVPCYGAVNFDAVVTACDCCPDVRLVKHVWDASVRRGLTVPLQECLGALQKSPLPEKEVVELLKWAFLRFDLPLSVPESARRIQPHRHLVRSVVAELPVVRAMPYLSAVLTVSACVNHVASFLLMDKEVLRQLKASDRVHEESFSFLQHPLMQQQQSSFHWSHTAFLDLFP